MQTLSEIKAMLAERGLRPRHALGQNFLIDHNLLAKLLTAANLKPGELILEVGPGTGTLTEALLAQGCRVLACEMDTNLASLLADRITSQGHAERFRLVQGDCLALGKRLNNAVANAIGDEPFKLVANLPYNAATPLILTLLIDHPRCSLIAATIQREVADRLTAQPATPDYGLLSILVQALATPHILAKLDPACFWPRPKVTSAMVLLERRPDPLTRDPRRLAELCHRLFSQRRKQLGTTLGRSTSLPPGIRPEQRPEELTPQQVVELMDLLPEP
ncbi:MAG: 16S rRNA (adenine(1518)-N(6)/adenine(1519)-N(6))-dimethyltransferase RsmA [bacterium]